MPKNPIHPTVIVGSTREGCVGSTVARRYVGRAPQHDPARDVVHAWLPSVRPARRTEAVAACVLPHEHAALRTPRRADAEELVA